MKTMIDFSLDFDRLLRQARMAWKQYDQLVCSFRHRYVCDPENMGYPADVQPKLEAARKQWDLWVKENILDRGLKLHEDMLGIPIGISAVLAEAKPGLDELDQEIEVDEKLAEPGEGAEKLEKEKEEDEAGISLEETMAKTASLIMD